MQMHIIVKLSSYADPPAAAYYVLPVTSKQVDIWLAERDRLRASRAHAAEGSYPPPQAQVFAEPDGWVYLSLPTPRYPAPEGNEIMLVSDSDLVVADAERVTGFYRSVECEDITWVSFRQGRKAWVSGEVSWDRIEEIRRDLEPPLHTLNEVQAKALVKEAYAKWMTAKGKLDEALAVERRAYDEWGLTEAVLLHAQESGFRSPDRAALARRELRSCLGTLPPKRLDPTLEDLKCRRQGTSDPNVFILRAVETWDQGALSEYSWSALTPEIRFWSEVLMREQGEAADE